MTHNQLLLARFLENSWRTLKSLIVKSIFLSEPEPSLSSNFVFRKILPMLLDIFLPFGCWKTICQQLYDSIQLYICQLQLYVSMAATKILFLFVKVLTSHMIIFATTKGIPLLAIQELLMVSEQFPRGKLRPG